MNKIIIFLLTSILLVSVCYFSGCIDTEQVDPGDITLTIEKVEKRLYDDNGNPASVGNIYLYIDFTIKNDADEELSTSTIWFELDSDEGVSYNPNWIFGTGGSTAKSVSKGASASYYIGFQIPENANISTDWELNYDGWQSKKSANLANIQSGFHDVYLTTLTIDDYYLSDTGDYSWDTASEGNAFLYVNFTLANSADNDESISTSRFNFRLYTQDGGYNPDGGESVIPDSINAGSEYSWYLYFEIPETAVLEKMVYDTYGIAPAEAWVIGCSPSNKFFNVPVNGQYKITFNFKLIDGIIWIKCEPLAWKAFGVALIEGDIYEDGSPIKSDGKTLYYHEDLGDNEYHHNFINDDKDLSFSFTINLNKNTNYYFRGILSLFHKVEGCKVIPPGSAKADGEINVKLESVCIEAV